MKFKVTMEFEAEVEADGHEEAYKEMRALLATVAEAEYRGVTCTGCHSEVLK